MARWRTVLARVAFAFGAIAAATVLTLLTRRLVPTAVPAISPFFFLGAILACSWFGGYAAGLPSVLFVTLVTQLLVHRVFDPFRLALLLLLSAAVSWISWHRRRLEAELRSRVDHSTAQLHAAVERLEREVVDRKAAEEEVRRLNHRLEVRVDERTRQLEVSNHELESFSYSVSHDLRAPLRSIDGFTRILLGTSAHKLDAEERALFERVLNAAGRMNTLIEDLLNLSRVTRAALRQERVDLSGLANRIAAELGKQYPATRFVVEPGLEATGDPGLIEVVLHNLLENGYKFSSRVADPCVEFGATNAGGQRVLYVRDNGAGFDPAYQSKLFIPFQRLHRQEEFPGTGIGLATVSRIVQRHGGSIRAESQPEKGATFYFTLSGLEGSSASHYLDRFPDSPSAHSTVM